MQTFIKTALAGTVAAQIDTISEWFPDQDTGDQMKLTMWDWSGSSSNGSVDYPVSTATVLGMDAVLGYEFNIAHKPNVNWQQEQKIYAYVGGE